MLKSDIYIGSANKENKENIEEMKKNTRKQKKKQKKHCENYPFKVLYGFIQVKNIGVL